MDQLGCEIRPTKVGPDTNEVGPKSATLQMAIKLPDSRPLRLLSKSFLFAMALLTLAWVYSAIMRAASSRLSLYRHHDSGTNAYGVKIMPVLLRNLVEEGLIKRGHMGFISGGLEDDHEVLRDAGIDLLTGADLKEEAAQEHRTFDFVFATSFMRVQALDHVIKENGLVIAPLGHDPSCGLRLPSGYKIVYLRRFESTVVAMKKIGGRVSGQANSKGFGCCGVTSEEKKAALKRLEDVYLEPPRREALEVKSKWSFTSRKIKFLPELLSDTLDEYPRRVFISDDSSAVDWFYKKYPTKDQEFEVYNVNSNDGVSNWLTEKVRREDYVVMKAEAQVVEEMLRGETLCLVDELFLECKNQWVDAEEEEEINGSKRAYWQCLALYGKVRDQGIAVHQWWG